MMVLSFNAPAFSSSQTVNIVSEKKQAINIPYFFAAQGNALTNTQNKKNKKNCNKKNIKKEK